MLLELSASWEEAAQNFSPEKNYPTIYLLKNMTTLNNIFRKMQNGAALWIALLKFLPE